MTYLIGIDGGGTSCRALIATHEGEVLGAGHAGSANISSDLKGGFENIMKSVRMAALEAGASESDLAKSSAVLGLAGANVGDYCEQMLPLLPFASSHITTDGHVALYGALHGEDGAVAILGTGSYFLSSVKNKLRTIGGWGFAVGDLCSGARLGRSLLQEALLTHDRVHEGSKLTETILDRFSNCPEAIVEFAQVGKPKDFGEFAPLLFSFEQDGDPIAISILGRAVQDLEENLNALIGFDGLPFCLLGGLAGEYSKRLSEPLKKWERDPKSNAQHGAILMGVNLFGIVKRTVDA